MAHLARRQNRRGPAQPLTDGPPDARESATHERNTQRHTARRATRHRHMGTPHAAPTEDADARTAPVAPLPVIIPFMLACSLSGGLAHERLSFDLARIPQGRGGGAARPLAPLLKHTRTCTHAHRKGPEVRLVLRDTSHGKRNQLHAEEYTACPGFPAKAPLGALGTGPSGASSGGLGGCDERPRTSTA